MDGSRPRARTAIEDADRRRATYPHVLAMRRTCSASSSARFPPPTNTTRRLLHPLDSLSRRKATRRLSRETRRPRAHGSARRQSPPRALNNPRAGHRPGTPEQKGRQRSRPWAMSSRPQIEPEIEIQTWTGERSSLAVQAGSGSDDDTPGRRRQRSGTGRGGALTNSKGPNDRPLRLRGPRSGTSSRDRAPRPHRFPTATRLPQDESDTRRGSTRPA